MAFSLSHGVADTAEQPQLNSLDEARRIRSKLCKGADSSAIARLDSTFDSTSDSTEAAIAPTVVGLLTGGDRREWHGELGGIAGAGPGVRALAVPPKRSLVFLATSGGGPGQELWGSRHYSSQMWAHSRCDPVATLTLAWNGRALAGDSVVIAGLNDVELAPSPVWTARAHPELGLTVVDGGTVAATRSDASVFSARGYPSLVVQGNRAKHDSAQTVMPTARAAEQTTRQLRLVFYVLQSMTDATERPRWTNAGRHRVFGAP